MLNPSTNIGRCLLLSAAALLFALSPAAGQDAAETPPAAVDSAPAELLPAPDRKPISRVVRAGDSAIESPTPPESTTDATFAAVPTTPILSSDLPSGGADEPFGSESEEGSVIPDEPIGTESPSDTADSNEPLVPATSDQPAARTESTVASDSPPEPAAGTGDAASEEEEATDDSEEEVEQTAAVAPVEGMIRIVYAPEASKVTDPARELLAPLIAKLNEDYGLRVKVLAYAEGDEDQSTHARGVSLSRALAMREYLTEQGIAMDRMDLRALGNTAQEEPADRVDLIAVSE